MTIKAKIAERPAGATWAQRYRADRRCGIDFAISLFMRSRAFELGGLVALTRDRLGILLRAVVLVIGGNWCQLFSADFEPDGRPAPLERRAFGAVSRRREQLKGGFGPQRQGVGRTLRRPKTS